EARDATEVYSESRREDPRVRLQAVPMVRGAGRDRGSGRAAEEQSGALLALRAASAFVRPAAGGTKLRLRGALADPSDADLYDAASELPILQDERREGAVGNRKEPIQHDLPVVLGDLGKSAELE